MNLENYILHEDIRQIDDLVLRKKSQVVDLNDLDSIQVLFDEMRKVLDVCAEKFEFSWAKGISAVQIGHLKRASLVWTQRTDWIEFLNPEIISESETQNYGWEGCLSFFDKRGLVPRPDEIKVKFFDINGSQKIETFEGNQARIICHEIDHMDGVLYIDRVVNDNYIMNVEKYKKLKETGTLPEIV